MNTRTQSLYVVGAVLVLYLFTRKSAAPAAPTSSAGVGGVPSTPNLNSVNVDMGGPSFGAAWPAAWDD